MYPFSRALKEGEGDSRLEVGTALAARLNLLGDVIAAHAVVALGLFASELLLFGGDGALDLLSACDYCQLLRRAWWWGEWW